MQTYFYALAERLESLLERGEVFTCNLDGEDSDFVRLNHNRIRQAGGVRQFRLRLDLILGRRHAAGAIDLIGNDQEDFRQLRDLIVTLREQRMHLPEDPYLQYATEVISTENRRPSRLPDSGHVIDQIVNSAGGLDLVGIWASGTQIAGFANSLGQRNWHETATFNLDWSCHQNGQSVKADYAGFEWDTAELSRKMNQVRVHLETLQRPACSLAPGRYRAYLAPAAVKEILDMMSWGGFGLKSHRTGQSPLIRMVREGQALHPGVSIAEHGGRGVSPRFTSAGFVRPERIALIERGQYRDCLADARSAAEYSVAVNSGGEVPDALDMAGGELDNAAVLSELGSGLYIGNLWYCNFSDRNACRITGMTRFACFQVENGRIRAPFDVMRFDESVYRLLGDRLAHLTRDREFIFDSSTYGQRSIRSYRLPGALIDDLTLTL